MWHSGDEDGLQSQRFGVLIHMVATGQEIVREKKILQGQGKVREFHFESGKIYIFEKSQGKVKF